MKDINNSLETLFNKMEDFISTKTVVGEPIHIGDTIILPLVDVFFGVGAASKDKKQSEEKSAGSLDSGGVGAKVEPSAVIVVNQKTSHVQLVNVKNQDSLNKLIDMAPGILAKIQESLAKRKNDKTEGEEGELQKENEIMKAILENDKNTDVEI